MIAAEQAHLLEPTGTDGETAREPGHSGDDLRKRADRDRDGLVDYLRGIRRDPSIESDERGERRTARRVLLIEDDESDARLAQVFLKRSALAPVAVSWFKSIAEAEADEAGHHNDIILLDLGLPDAHGLEAVRAVRRFAPQEAIVVLSGNEDEELAIAALHEGAQDYLVKGTFDAAALCRCMRHAIARVESEQMLRLAIVKLLVRSDELIAEVGRREDIEDKLRHEKEQLAAVGAHLLELDQAKDDFLAAVSHELRTPLTSIIGYIELTLDDPDWSPSETEALALDVIERNSRRLLALVEDLLRSTQLDSDRVVLKTSEIEVYRLVEPVVETVQPMASERSQLVSVDIASDLPPVQVDRQQIERVLINLLDNARKFSPDGAPIIVSAQPNHGGVVISVIDQGTGIPADEQVRLFEPFARGAQALTDAVQGAGLGLSIVKSIIEQHKGDISVESAVGSGTTISFTLPSSTQTASLDRGTKQRKAA